MPDALESIGELSQMRRTLTQETLEDLHGISDRYVDRLYAITMVKTSSTTRISGTNVTRPSVLANSNRNSRLREKAMPVGFSMNVREMATAHGRIVLFPMHTIGLTDIGVPIIDTDQGKNSYTILHLPKQTDAYGYSPAYMRADLAFTVDQDNLVTVNGMNPVSVAEYALFDAIVCEFESRLEPSN